MERIPRSGFIEEIREAYRLIPEELHRFLRADFLCGVDPVFAGLHSFEFAGDGRAYSGIAHCVYPEIQEVDRPNAVTTVVLPIQHFHYSSVETIIHELGHVLDYTLGLSWKTKPVSWYAHTDRRESFAEAFTGFVLPGHTPVDTEDVIRFRALVDSMEGEKVGYNA